MPRRGSILLSTANEIGSALVNKLGGSGYAPVEWDKKINIMGIASEDIPDALDNLIPSEGGGDRGSILISKANEIGAVLNKKFQTERGFKPKEWASAISKLTPLQVKTASGAIASFPDGAEAVPLTSLICDINPKQDLHGYSKPWAPGAGKNKANIYAVETCSETSGAGSSITQNNNGTISVTATTQANVKSLQKLKDIAPGLVVDSSYTLSAVSTGSTKYIYLHEAAQTWNFGAAKTITQTMLDSYVSFYASGNNSSAVISDFQIEAGSSPTSFEPYSNICPISGSTQTTAYQLGGNLLEVNAQSKEQSDVTWTVNADGSITLEGTSSARTYLYAHGYHKLLPKDATITISVEGLKDNGANDVFVNLPYSDNGVTYSGSYGQITWNNPTKTISYTSDKYIGFLIDCPANVATDQTIKIMVTIGSTPSTYEKYKQKTPVVAQFGETIYGGYVDIVTGILTVTHASISLPSSGWTFYQTGGKNTFNITIPNCKNELAYCEVYLYEYHQYIAQQSDKTFMFYASGDNVKISICDNDYSSASDFGAFIGGKQLVYELETPIEIDLEDPQEVESYLGYNNIYNDTGDTSASYYADIDLDNV